MDKRDVIYVVATPVLYVLKLFIFVTILLSNHWAEGNGSNFGVLKYCAHNETSCEKVTDKLQTITDQLNTSLAFICISIILTSIWLITSLVSFCILRYTERQIGGYTKKYHFINALLLVIIDAVTQIVFATGVQELLEAYSLGWTFYCVIVLLVLTIVSLLPFWISTDEPCKEFFSTLCC
uniref:Uncharacterized protein LOC111101620 isoform X2 n=1 Tax=Crassostrea virginica TaxID=6565 RepID=A0A8B8AFD2_CRAVI|nr:uncharacterized protein LOC111101620 isoform X2 [Crassostrea virginica]